MAGKSNYLELEVLKWATGQTNDLGTAASPDVALYVTAPANDTDAGTECTGTGYARADSTGAWGAPTGSGPATCANNAAVTFPTATAGDWGTIVAFGIFNGTDRLYWNTLTASKIVAIDETARFPAGDLSLTEG